MDYNLNTKDYKAHCEQIGKLMDESFDKSTQQEGEEVMANVAALGLLD